MNNQFPIDIANRIARRLVAFGYPGITGEYVQEELRKPKNERNVIGLFATDLMLEYGLADEDQS